MKGLFAIPFLALALTSFQASALCLYVTESFSGGLPPRTAVVVNGPFTITAEGGCAGANIEASISGSGRTPEMHIERQIGGVWRRAAFNIGNNASYSGGYGTYQIRVINQDNDSKSYSGTVRYGR